MFTRCFYMLSSWTCFILKFEKRSDKGQCQTHPGCWCEEYPCNVTKCNHWGVIVFTRRFDLDLVSKFIKSTDSYVPRLLWTSIKFKKGHTNINVKLVPRFWCEHPYISINQSRQFVNFYCADKIWMDGQMDGQRELELSFPDKLCGEQKGHRNVNIKFIYIYFDVENIPVKL